MESVVWWIYEYHQTYRIFTTCQRISHGSQINGWVQSQPNSWMFGQMALETSYINYVYIHSQVVSFHIADWLRAKYDFFGKLKTSKFKFMLWSGREISWASAFWCLDGLKVVNHFKFLKLWNASLEIGRNFQPNIRGSLHQTVIHTNPKVNLAVRKSFLACVSSNAPRCIDDGDIEFGNK